MRDKIKLLLMRKNIKKEIRKDVENYDTKHIAEILVESRSMKKAKKDIFTELKLIHCMNNEKGRKVHESRGIAEVATHFYRNLYKGDEYVDNEMEVELDTVSCDFPKKLLEEVSKAIKTMKVDEAMGPIENNILKDVTIKILKNFWWILCSTCKNVE